MRLRDAPDAIIRLANSVMSQTPAQIAFNIMHRACILKGSALWLVGLACKTSSNRAGQPVVSMVSK